MLYAAAVLLVLSLVAFALCHFKRRGLRTPRAMKTVAQKYVGDPKYRESVTRSLRDHTSAIETAESSPAPSDRELPAIVGRLLSSERTAQIAARIRIEKAGARACPALLAALNDPATSWKPDDASLLATVPGARVLEMLNRLESREAGERVAHLVDHADWRIFKPAIKARAMRGRGSDAGWMVGVLRDQTHENWGMRVEAIERGVSVAINRGWADPGLIDALVAWARQNIIDANERPSDWAVRFFAQHGGPGAIATLQSPELLSLENYRNIHFILRALSEAGVRFPAAQLHAFIRQALSNPTWPWPWVYEPALNALARHDPEGALTIARRELDRNREPFTPVSMKFIEAYSGLPRAWELPPPSMPLSDEERRILDTLAVVSDAAGQIGNGGLSQYFFNSTGDHWPRDVEAFRAIGYAKGAEALDRAARIVDRKGASLDREVRMRQYADLSEAREAELDKLSPIFWGTTLDQAMLDYMLTHSELYRRVKAARVAAGMDQD